MFYMMPVFKLLMVGSPLLSGLLLTEIQRCLSHLPGMRRLALRRTRPMANPCPIATRIEVTLKPSAALGKLYGIDATFGTNIPFREAV